MNRLVLIIFGVALALIVAAPAAPCPARPSIALAASHHRPVPGCQPDGSADLTAQGLAYVCGVREALPEDRRTTLTGKPVDDSGLVITGVFACSFLFPYAAGMEEAVKVLSDPAGPGEPLPPEIAEKFLTVTRDGVCPPNRRWHPSDLAPHTPPSPPVAPSEPISCADFGAQGHDHRLSLIGGLTFEHGGLSEPAAATLGKLDQECAAQPERVLDEAYLQVIGR